MTDRVGAAHLMPGIRLIIYIVRIDGLTPSSFRLQILVSLMQELSVALERKLRHFTVEWLTPSISSVACKK